MSGHILLLFDWIICLPITLIRLIIIYFIGSKYNIRGLHFLDVMMHANNKYFNQNCDDDPTIDTISSDIRKVIKYDNYIYDLREPFNKTSINTINNSTDNNHDHIIKETQQNDDLAQNNNSSPQLSINNPNNDSISSQLSSSKSSSSQSSSQTLSNVKDTSGDDYDDVTYEIQQNNKKQRRNFKKIIESVENKMKRMMSKK